MKWDEFFTKINFITFLWEDPCDAPWTVYVETAGPALMELFVSLYGLDLFDLQKTKYQRTLNPYRLRSNRKGNTGSKKRRSRWQRRLGALVSFDPNEASGRRLSPAIRPQQTRFSVGRASLFLIGGVLERLVWQWFLVSQLFEFLFNWTSALLETEACADKATSVCLRSGGDQTVVGVSGYIDLIFGDLIKQRGAITSTGVTIHVPANMKWVAMANVGWFVIPPGNDATVSYRIYNEAGNRVISEGYQEHCVQGVPYQATLNASESNATALTVEIRVQGGFIRTTEQTFYVMAKPR